MNILVDAAHLLVCVLAVGYSVIVLFAKENK